jgi:hypothetical protein
MVRTRAESSGWDLFYAFVSADQLGGLLGYFFLPPALCLLFLLDAQAR